MYLHDNGCICPKPEIVTRDKTVNTKADIDTETETGESRDNNITQSVYLITYNTSVEYVPDKDKLFLFRE